MSTVRIGGTVIYYWYAKEKKEDGTTSRSQSLLKKPSSLCLVYGRDYNRIWISRKTQAKKKAQREKKGRESERKREKRKERNRRGRENTEINRQKEREDERDRQIEEATGKRRGKQDARSKTTRRMSLWSTSTLTFSFIISEQPLEQAFVKYGAFTLSAQRTAAPVKRMHR